MNLRPLLPRPWLVPSTFHIANAQPPAGFTCQIQNANGTNDEYFCTGNLPANTHAQGEFQLTQPATQGMGGALFGFQGMTQRGPFQITGP